MRSDVFGKSSKFHTDNVFEWSLYGDFPGLLGQLTSVTYPRRTGGKRLASSLGPRDPKRIGLGTKGPTIWLRKVYISLQEFFLSKSVCWIFFSEITHTPPPPPPPHVKCSALAIEWAVVFDIQGGGYFLIRG